MSRSAATLTQRTAAWFEGMAASLDKVARSRAYAGNLPARAAITREIAHYLECAARLRGQPIAPLKQSRRRA